MKNISSAAFQLILNNEVGGGRQYYERYLASPTWPGGESGVTIGIGYDLGYTAAKRFLSDWAALGNEDRQRLISAIEVKGILAQDKARLLHDIFIPWEIALAVFQNSTIPLSIEETIKAFPGSQALPADAFGALVSLVFNRGPSMEGDRRTEMRWIRTAVAQEDLSGIAKSLRAMKRLWIGKGLDGLIARREAEAQLVESAI